MIGFEQTQVIARTWQLVKSNSILSSSDSYIKQLFYGFIFQLCIRYFHIPIRGANNFFSVKVGNLDQSA